MQTIISNIKQAVQNIHSHMQIHNTQMSNMKKNSSGDVQKPLDIISNDIIKNTFSQNSNIVGIISEEDSNFISINPQGEYIIAFDPMDGSGNSQINLSTGSIFCIFKCKTLGEVSGNKIVGAIYTIYGAMLELVTVIGDKKDRYYFNPHEKNFQ